MKLSIITVCLNSHQTIADTINSVNSQTFNNIEHIFVDGGSQDETIELIKKNPNKNKKIFIKKNYGIYKSMNYGIKKASGDLIQILNSDDVFQSNDIVEKVIKNIKKNPQYDLYLGNVVFFKGNNFNNSKRHFTAKSSQIKNMINGQMPPHPACFVRKEIYRECIMYNEKYKIAADFEFFNEIFNFKKKKFKILNQNVVRMRLGGISTRGLKSYLNISKEIIKSLKKKNQKYNLFKVYFRRFYKLREIFFLKKNKLNSDFKIFNFNFNKEYYYKNCFKILRNINLDHIDKNFILSGMNLAFLGYYSNHVVFPSKFLYHWPDGIFASKIFKIKKIPGRDLINNLKLDKKIKIINVIGNITKRSKNYLDRKFKRKINHIQLPYGSISDLKNRSIKIKKNELTLITLPTPKQEQLANHLIKSNKYFKIICIGGSIAIASGEERKVPRFLNEYEFIWRLKTDPLRRIKRLIETLFFYIKGRYIVNSFDNLIFKIIEKK